jgi:hypothetical protein
MVNLAIYCIFADSAHVLGEHAQGAAFGRPPGRASPSPGRPVAPKGPRVPRGSPLLPTLAKGEAPGVPVHKGSRSLPVILPPYMMAELRAELWRACGQGPRVRGSSSMRILIPNELRARRGADQNPSCTHLICDHVFAKARNFDLARPRHSKNGTPGAPQGSPGGVPREVAT